jgi:hypothetical protein
MIKSQNTFIVLCLLALLPLNGCFFEPIIKNPRSLAPGKKSLNIAAEYWNVNATQTLNPQPTPTPTYTYGAPASLTQSAQFWASNIGFRIGTWYPGLECGLSIAPQSGSLIGDLKYQFMGFEKNPDGVAGAVGLEFGALYEPFTRSSAGYAVAGTLSFGDRFGPADLYAGTRLGFVNNGPTVYDSSYYSNPWGSDDPANYYYNDVYVGSELDILSRMSLVLGFSMKNLLNQPYAYTTSYYYYASSGSTYDTTFAPIYTFSIGISFHSRSLPLNDEERLEEQRDRARIQARRNRRRHKATDEEEDPRFNLKMAEGKRLMNAGSYLPALAEFAELEDPNIQNFNLEMSIGYCHYMLKNWGASLKHYQKALELAPDNAKLEHTVENLKQKVQAATPAVDEKGDELLPK